jgi:hypothetical protein
MLSLLFFLGTVVWGTSVAADDDNVVWGSFAAADNDNIVWGV